VEVMV